jgi:peptidoglycan/xylan/chitin deacetylase (PgdA/CDA1 family)
MGGSIQPSSIFPASKDRPEIAITIDDFNWNKALKLDPDQRNRALLGALRAYGNLKAALFVACKFADNDKGRELLQDWDRAGHLIGNHSYSHKFLNSTRVTAADYTATLRSVTALLRPSLTFKNAFVFHT